MPFLLNFYKFEPLFKGAPARKSRTGTPLVSPATGCEKKKWHLWNRALEHKTEHIRNIISIHRCYGEWYNSRKAPKTRKRVKKKHIPECPSIFGQFFVSSVNATNSYSLHQPTIWLKTWALFKSLEYVSQILGIKAKIDNVIQTALPILDAEGYAICPDCDSRVNCGTIGLANLEKRHRGKKICKAVQQKRDKEAKKKKDGNILSFLKPKAASVPSTVNIPTPVHSYNLKPATPWHSANDAIPAASTTALQDETVNASVSPMFTSLFQDLFLTASSKHYQQVFPKHPKLGVHGLWGIRARTRREASTSMRSYYYI